MLAALEARLRQAAGERLHELGERAPAERLPDAELLFAQRRRVRACRGMVEQELREGRLRLHGIRSSVATQRAECAGR